MSPAGPLAPEERIPVIIGVADITEHPTAMQSASSPLNLMHQALLTAEQDSGCGGWLERLDSVDIVNSITCHYADLEGDLSQRLGHQPRHCVQGPVGGESPVRYLHEAAARILRGESQVAAVCGAEAMHALSAAKRNGVDLGWPAQDDSWLKVLADTCPPEAVALDVAKPANVYPFYENALAAASPTPAHSLEQSATLWARYAVVAANNPYAWSKQRYSAQEILTPTPDNRLVTWPYTKHMVANPMVNQGAAVLLTSLAQAKAAGIAPQKLIYLWTGASALEPRNYLARSNYRESPAMESVLRHCATAVDRPFDHVELYSCFPCVPRMALQTLTLTAGVEPSVAGGLSFFGAPLNNYMTHAATAMVRRLRERAGKTGLLYGQGEFVTKHHALVLSSSADSSIRLSAEHSVQPQADLLRGAAPEYVGQASGTAQLETFTLLYQRDGSISHGVVILRIGDDQRTLARVPASDNRTLSRLIDLSCSPIGCIGTLNPTANGISNWEIA